MADLKFDCPHCQQPLKYEADMAGLELPCPTCAKTIRISAQTVRQPASEPASPSLQKKQPASRQTIPGSATPKQIAYLTFMGYPKADCLTKDQASQAIDTLGNGSNPREYERIVQLQSEWIRQRFILYPDLYSYELKNFFIHELPETLHTFVRNRMVGASERLTKTKIRQVVNAIGAEDADWWKEINFKDRFWSKLQEMHPLCCDGQQKQANKDFRAPEQESWQLSSPTAKPRGSGCLVVMIVILSAVAAVAAMIR